MHLFMGANRIYGVQHEIQVQPGAAANLAKSLKESNPFVTALRGSNVNFVKPNCGWMTRGLYDYLLQWDEVIVHDYDGNTVYHHTRIRVGLDSAHSTVGAAEPVAASACRLPSSQASAG